MRIPDDVPTLSNGVINLPPRQLYDEPGRITAIEPATSRSDASTACLS